jgi:hypothetical protein
MRHTSLFAHASRKTTSYKAARIHTLLLAAFSMLALGRPAHAQYDATGLEATSPVPTAQPRPQDPEAYLERQSVADRPRPDFEPLGMHLDSFYIYPSLSVGALYDDNVYYVPHNRTGDGAVVISPTIDVKSDWNVNAVEFFGTADIQRYFNQTTEDTANYAFGMNGRHDIDYNTYLSGVVSYQQSHEDRGSPDAIFGIEPTPFTLTHAEVKYYRGLTRLNLTLIEGVDRYEFSNVGLAGGGFIDEVRRDRTENYTTIRVGYELKPEYEAFVRATESNRFYDFRTDLNGVDATSVGYEVVGGTALKFGAVTNGEVYLGWTERFYEGSNVNDLSAPVIGASLLWNVTRETSLRLQVNRSIEESVLVGSNGFVLSFGQVSIEHELLRNLLLTGYASISGLEYQGVDRTDIVYGAGAGAKYLMNRNFDVSLTYGFLKRQSDAIGQDYAHDLLMLKFTGKL